MLPLRIENLYPIMGKDSLNQKCVSIDLSVANSILMKDIDFDHLNRYVQNYLNAHQAKYAIGGYLEQRNLYALSEHFGSENRRDVHLGIDIWTKARHAIYAPISGLIHSFAYNSQELDYGYTLILEHSLNGHRFYTLYGHLSNEYYKDWRIGKQISAGRIIASLGDNTENGGWPPHLHFQCINEVGDWYGDYPGVSRESELHEYSQNCPNPSFLLKIQAQRNPSFLNQCM